MAGSFNLLGSLKGHGGWVTSIVAPAERQDKIISSSRDKTVMVWDVSEEARRKASYRAETEGALYGLPKWALVGHADFVQDVAVSSDGQFALSGSWDRTLHLWDVKSAHSRETFNGHTKDVTAVAFSADNRAIISASRDQSLRVWNILGECKHVTEHAHNGWVSSVKFSPSSRGNLVVSGGWDKAVKMWELTEQDGLRCANTLTLHRSQVSSVTIAPDGSLCASGARDGVAMLWDVTKGEQLFSLNEPGGGHINALTFSPMRYWLCAATATAIRIWDLESKEQIAELKPEAPKVGSMPECVSLAWSSDGGVLYGGYTDNTIRVWQAPSA